MDLGHKACDRPHPARPGFLGRVLQTDVDLLILGGGCAGLSLALRLAEAPGHCRRVTVIEARPAYVNDRSWCFWRLGSHRFESLVTRSWSRVAVRSASRVVDIDCTLTPYQLLESSAFYEHARGVIEGKDTVRLVMDVSVAGPPRAVPGGWCVETSAGALTATQVIDTRPQKIPRHGDATLWQSFVGQELVCERPVFDGNRVELMDFTDAVPEAVAFTYVLPLAPNRALVETTLFDPHPCEPADLMQRQRQAVQRLCGNAPVHVVRTESGILPMGLVRSESALGHGHLQAGLTSGAARPDTHDGPAVPGSIEKPARAWPRIVHAPVRQDRHAAHRPLPERPGNVDGPGGHRRIAAGRPVFAPVAASGSTQAGRSLTR